MPSPVFSLSRITPSPTYKGEDNIFRVLFSHTSSVRLIPYCGVWKWIAVVCHRSIDFATENMESGIKQFIAPRYWRLINSKLLVYCTSHSFHIYFITIKKMDTTIANRFEHTTSVFLLVRWEYLWGITSGMCALYFWNAGRKLVMMRPIKTAHSERSFMLSSWLGRNVVSWQDLISSRGLVLSRPFPDIWRIKHWEQITVMLAEWPSTLLSWSSDRWLK